MERKVQVGIFFGAVIFMAAAFNVHEAMFNNFLDDTFAMSAGMRGFLELPREFPGFMVVIMAGMLAALPVTRLAAVGALVFALGMAGLAFFGGSFSPMVMLMMLASAGQHILQPVGSSIALSLSGSRNKGMRMAQMGVIGTVGMFIGAGVVKVLFDWMGLGYRTAFLVGSGLGLIGMIYYLALHVPSLHAPRARLVFRRKYWLYYLLEVFFGARKQIFITFGPWVLIRVYGEEPARFGQLLMIAAAVGLVFKFLVGVGIDKLGERFVLMADGVFLALVCLGYGYAFKFTGDFEMARHIAYVCFIADNLLFSIGSARAVYVSRLADSPGEVTSTLAMGISINHIVSMTIPMVAGLAWTIFGFEKVFLGAAILALLSIGLSSLVPRRSAA
ncbi:MFS transporter [bacterium]|nr:MFS transporter [bacterium]